MKTLAIYDAYIAAYIQGKNAEDMDAHSVFMWELHNIGIDVTRTEAKALAYDIAYEGASVASDELQMENE